MNGPKYLLKEFFALCEGGVCQDYLTENEKQFVSSGGMILTGIAQRADHKNGNKRIYPFNVLQREVENYKKFIRENRALGCCDHEDSPEIKLQNTSHLVTDIWWNGKDVMVKLKVLSTPMGQVLRSLVNDGVQIGLSSRGLGSVKDMGDHLMVESDFQLICFDVVAEPSTQGAFMQLSESKAFNSSLTKADKINRCINDILLRK